MPCLFLRSSDVDLLDACWLGELYILDFYCSGSMFDRKSNGDISKSLLWLILYFNTSSLMNVVIRLALC